MQNFDYQTPTRLIFGKGVVKQTRRQFGKKILLTYGDIKVGRGLWVYFWLKIREPNDAAYG